MNREIVEAFKSIHDGWSVDHVIADPELNSQFIEACRQHGLQNTPTELNLKLYNLRKRGGLLPQSTKRTFNRNQDQYIFAAEIAIRSLEKRHQTTLDTVLCDPDLAKQFDEIASSIAPGYNPLDYRRAALNLRKKSRLKPEILSRVVQPEVLKPMVATEFDITSAPQRQGVYIFTSRDKTLYVGEAKNLRTRLKKHLDHSDNKWLARYIWESNKGDLFIELHLLPDDTKTKVRKAIELELIRSRNPEFNVQR